MVWKIRVYCNTVLSGTLRTTGNSGRTKKLHSLWMQEVWQTGMGFQWIFKTPTHLPPLLPPFNLSAEGDQLPPKKNKTKVQITRCSGDGRTVPGRRRPALTVASESACGCGWGTAWSWWSAACTCAGWSAASRSGSRQSAPGPSHSFCSASPAQGGRISCGGYKECTPCPRNLTTIHKADINTAASAAALLTLSHIRAGKAALSITFMYRKHWPAGQTEQQSSVNSQLLTSSANGK